MWRSVVIDDKNYLFKCTLNTEKNDINYSLCNFQKIWSETLMSDEFLTRLKVLNKRIEYERKTAIETINSDKLPDQITISSANHDDDIILNLKYYILDSPLIYQWNLKICDQTEFEKCITNPLLISLCYSYQKNQELLKVINEKDIEINQYKEEGAVLRRKALATEIFDQTKFETKYPEISITNNVLLHSIANLNTLETACQEFITKKQTELNLPSDGGTGRDSTKSLKASPLKSKKKRLRQIQQQILGERIKARENKINYQDSDSPCTSSLEIP